MEMFVYYKRRLKYTLRVFFVVADYVPGKGKIQKLRYDKGIDKLTEKSPF